MIYDLYWKFKQVNQKRNTRTVKIKFYATTELIYEGAILLCFKLIYKYIYVCV